jgi:flagellar protein FlaI
MKKELRKSKKKIRLDKVFKRAVEGYKQTKKEPEEKEIQYVPVGIRETKKPVEKMIEGISLTEKVSYAPRPEPGIELRTVNIMYPLIPRKSKTPFAAANIRWSRGDSALIYKLVEPELTSDEQALLGRIKAALIEKLDVDFTQLRKSDARAYLVSKFQEMITLMAIELPEQKQKELLYYIERDFVGLGKIEPLMQDPDIEDISCDGIGIPIYIYHRNPDIGSVRTNVVFKTGSELDKFVNKLSQRCGKTISVAKPLVGGSLPEGSRIQATLGTDIARKGSNFSIRKFTEEPLTPVHLVKLKTLNPMIASYLWLAIEYGRSMLITGGVASGKTSLLNALSLFIKPQLRIVSIEDTPELRLPHPHWVPHVARQPIAELEGRRVGEVDLFDLLRESLRQRPDYLIVGEVRGREAYVLFQQIATGHASMSTIHADSMERLIDRLITPPINLPANLIAALDIIIFLVKVKKGNAYVRRIGSIYEILGFDREKDTPIVNEVFRWDPLTDSFKSVNPSVVFRKISEQFGINEKVLQNELNQRSKILKWMFDKGIANYKDVARIVRAYYTSPDELLDAVK